jgi:diguanylate cyclase (GGDEF)-like protein/PAS domain S-box-containing protein
MMLKLSKAGLHAPYLLAVGAAGAAACAVSAYRQATAPAVPLDLGFIVLAVLTVGFSARLSVRIPRTKAEITVSDTLVFLIILLYGGDVAVLVYAAEALACSVRFTRRLLTRFFNVGMMALSTFVTVWALRLSFGAVPQLTQSDHTAELAAAVTLMAFTQYVMNAGLASVADALRSGQPVWQTWVNKFLWTSISYFAGASAAGIVARLLNSVGVSAVVVAAPIIAIVYFTYRVYLRNVEFSQEQAAQARAHVEELNRHLAEQERIGRALQESEEHFRNAFDHAAGMALVAPDGRWLRVNSSLCRMLGYTDSELRATRLQALTPSEDLGPELVNLDRLARGEAATAQLEKRLRHKDGHDVWVLSSASAVRDKRGEPAHFIFQIQDITERKRAEEQVHFAAFHDALTGLPNRVLFSERLTLALERSRRRRDYQFAVLFIDLDRFKIINDSLGHSAGDKLLVEVARRLEACLRPTDTVARLGGDEFAVLLDGVGGGHDPEAVAARVQQKLARPFDLDGHEVFTSASIGIALSGTGYDNYEDILRDSDTAMYRAKSNGKARHEVFDRDMHTRAVEQLRLENDLRRAIERGEIEVFYQPVVDLSAGRLAGFEALARWRHPTRGLVPPADFIPLAEENGLIVPLGALVLRLACRQVSEWRRSRPTARGLSVSVNISAKQFQQPGLVAMVETTLAEAGLPAPCLRLEVTETVLMQNAEAAAEMLEGLKRLGVKLAIDDFGTGYSSLSYLHRFPFDTLKVDRSFVGRMTTDAESRGIVETILLLASKLGKDVVAEGVETAGQRDALAAAGCRYAQGYLFARPAAAADAEAFLAEKREWLGDWGGAAHPEPAADVDVTKAEYPM